MVKFRKEKAGKDGWSRWITPNASHYLVGCCDCNLVHTMQFRVSDGGKVQFKVQRNDAETCRQRGDGGSVATGEHDVVVRRK